jgi:hypothetical protein
MPVCRRPLDIARALSALCNRSCVSVCHAQCSKTPRPTQDKDHDGGPILALSGLSRARHDGLYRTLGTLTTSSTAGRDCLPATRPFRLRPTLRRTTYHDELSRVQRAAKHPIHASATCVRQHTATSQIELRACEQSMDVLSPCALAAANASHHALFRVREPFRDFPR